MNSPSQVWASLVTSGCLSSEFVSFIDEQELISLDEQQFGKYERTQRTIQFVEDVPLKALHQTRVEDGPAHSEVSEESDNAEESGESEEEVMKIQDIEELIECKRPREPVRPNDKYCCNTGCYPCIFDTYDEMVEKYETKLSDYQQKVDEFCTKFKVRYEEQK
ncbi:unnamed protein product [Moneuplotes crassus]|uniref:Oxidoreductase-like domain-containing protein n=1 Tax=Euplotes crassus TaxID=5936 RepID=A0AAD2D878_EUPCR|nr:unnamed protein product [Moneuplotes crassus]